ncbi:hypothetical protein RI835_003231 [Providencia rettgeri]|nr:hypothetical protein [Providencia rettgeri]
MSDYISPLVKAISSIISIKSAISFIFVGIGLTCSWIYIKPYLDIYEYPDDIKNFSLTSVGIGGGILVSKLLFYFHDFVHYLINKRKIASEKRQLKAKNILFIQSNIGYFSVDQLDVLWDLNTSSGQVYTKRTDKYRAAQDLIVNGMIYKVSDIDSNRTLFQINSTIKTFLTNFFFSKHRDEIKTLFTELPERFHILLPFFTLKEDNNDEIKQLPYTLQHQNFAPFIVKDFCYIREQYYSTLSFDKDYKSHFESILSTKFIDSFAYDFV